MTTDVILTQKPYYDITWTETGDIATDQTLDTYILMCLFAEQRATEDEVPQSDLRRGWIGNETTPGFEQGSKAWLFEQDRITISMLAELGTVVRNSLQPLIDDDLATDVSVGQPFLRNGTIIAPIDITRPGSSVDRRYYELWNNTGVHI